MRSDFFSVSDMIRIHARNRPQVPAWQTATEQISWAQFDRMVTRSANALAANGVRKGHAVAMLINSSLWSWTHLFGAMRAGAVVTPLNTMLSPAAIAALLADSQATHLMVSSDSYSLASESLKLAAASGATPLLLSPDGGLPGSANLTQLAAAAPADWPGVRLEADDAANIIYSSGTTGVPKGIVHSHAARTAFATTFAAAFRCSASTRTLLTTPPHTNGSYMVILPTIAVGGTLYISEGFRPDRYLDEIRDFRPTFAFMVPTMAQALVDLPRAHETDWSCFDFIVTAGAPMPAELKRRTREITGERLGELWGFTEGVATVMQPHEMRDHPSSVGRPIIQCEVRVIDQDGHEVPPGVVGELVGRCAMQMSHYHNRPDADRAITWRSSDGIEFLRTGDLGFMDEAGWITIKGRCKDMLISGGLNIYPSDIEAVLLGHETVADCAVVGVPHAKWGETPVAFVEAKASASVDAAVLRTWLNERVGRHQRVHEVVVTESLPRNTLGKVLKYQLAQAYGEAR